MTSRESMAITDWMLSIDFGTSNTAAAHSGATSGAVETLALTHSSNLMRSAVYIASRDDISVGDVAINAAEQDPVGFLAAPKRLIGQPVVAVNGGQLPLSVPISAVFATVVKRAVAAHGGRRPARLVLTHPEAWSPQQVGVLTEAAQSIGMRPEQISTVSEPRAAAQYYTRSHSMRPGSRIAVFDFGGGTLDIAVLAAEAPATDRGESAVRFTVLAARGDNGMGGKNFDALVRGWVDQQLATRNPDALEFLRGSAPTSVKQALDDSIRRAKELLSEAPSATISMVGGGFHETFHITRAEFDELIGPVADRAVALARATLADAGITDPGQLDALYLTGGSSRVPLVHQRLQEVGPVATLDDPKTVVAQGALVAVQTPRHSEAAQPVAPDLMSSWQQGSSGQAAPPVAGPAADPGAGPAPAPQTTGTSRTRYAMIGAAVVVVAAAVAVGAYFGLSGGNDPASDSAAAAPTSAPPTAGGDSGNSVEEIKAGMPSALRNSVQQCTLTEQKTSAGTAVMNCYVRPGSDAGTGLSSSVRISAYLSTAEARNNIDSILNNSDGELGDQLVTNTARTAAGEIDGGATADITYANTVSGLGVSTNGIADVSAARQFLSDSGLIRE